jgi:hypothetical protein
MEMDCSAHQIYPVSKIQIYVALMLVVSSQLQVIMNASVTKVSLEMELCVKVSLKSTQYGTVMLFQSPRTGYIIRSNNCQDKASKIGRVIQLTMCNIFQHVYCQAKIWLRSVSF